MNDEDARELWLLILRNQRAIMKNMVLKSTMPAEELIDQARETHDYLKSHNALKPKKDEK